MLDLDPSLFGILLKGERDGNYYLRSLVIFFHYKDLKMTVTVYGV